jgi:predicted ATPase
MHRLALLGRLNRAHEGSPVVVLTGVRGAGKTQLAAAYARAQLGSFAGSMAVLQQAGQPVVRVEFSQPSPLGLLASQ